MRAVFERIMILTLLLGLLLYSMFLPWERSYHSGAGVAYELVYAPIWSPPVEDDWHVAPKWSIIGLHWATIGLVVALATLYARRLR